MLRPRVHITYDVLRTLHADVPTFSTHHSLFITQRHEFRPNVVAIAERILITVWMISFQVSLFFINKKTPSAPFGASPPLWGEHLLREEEDFVKGLKTPTKDPPSRRGLRSHHCGTD